MLAVIGIIYGAVCALGQRDVKRLVAYSSVSHLGFVVLGLFALTQQAVTGGVLQMVNHGLATGALFLLVGMVYDRTHTRRLDEMGGLASVRCRGCSASSCSRCSRPRGCRGSTASSGSSW